MKTLKKEMVSDTIYEKHWDHMVGTFKYSDLPKDLLDTDDIRFEDVEAYFSENDSWDDHSILKVYRDREETDEEFEKRKGWVELDEKFRKERRYESYLKLKKEFEE